MKKIILSYLLTLLLIPPSYSDSCELPFIFENGLLLTTGTVNGQEGYLIIDTGAPELILNDEYFEGKPCPGRIVGMEKNIDFNEVRVKSLEWGCLEKKNKLAICVSMQHLENSTGRKIIGLLGYRYLKQQELSFDFDQQILTLISYKTPFEHHDYDSFLKFRLSDHLPILSVQLNHQEKLLFGFDTGASINVLDHYYSRLCETPNHPQVISVVSVDQSRQVTKGVSVESIEIGTMDFEDMLFVTKDLQRVRDFGHYNLYGFLGYPFLQQCQKMVISYKQKRIYIWQRTNYTYLMPD